MRMLLVAGVRLPSAMVIAEARLSAFAAGAYDVLGWLLGLVTAALAIDEIVRNGISRRAIAIILAVSAANFVGTLVGVDLSRAVLH